MSDTLIARWREYVADLVLGPQPWESVGAPIPDLFATPTVLAPLGPRAAYAAAFEGRLDV